jgi:hypothetical protein
VVSAISLSALVYATIAAIRNRLALWSYTWVGATMVGLVVSLNLVLDDRAFAFSRGTDVAIIVLVLLSCLVVFCRVALMGWQHTGLFSIGVCGVLGLSIVFFGVAGASEYHVGLLSGLLGLVEATLVYAFLRSRSNAVRVLVVLGVGCANVAVAWIIEAVFRATVPSRPMSQFWLLAALLSGLLLGGTLAGVAGRFVRRKVFPSSSDSTS